MPFYIILRKVNDGSGYVDWHSELENAIAAANELQVREPVRKVRRS